jgi:hypothetical protein
MVVPRLLPRSLELPSIGPGGERETVRAPRSKGGPRTVGGRKHDYRYGIMARASASPEIEGGSRSPSKKGAGTSSKRASRLKDGP